VKFDDIDLAKAPEKALGTLLAHSVSTPRGRIKKGTRLGKDHLVRLQNAGVKMIAAAIPEPGDILEDEAAARLAGALCGAGLKCNDATTGRANLHGTRDGLLLVDYDRINRINMVDERITIATLDPWAPLTPGQLAVTVKIITYGVPEYILDQAIKIAEAGDPAVSIASFKGKSVALIMSRLSEADTKLLEKGRQATKARLARFGSALDHEQDVDHTVEDIAAAVSTAGDSGAQLILILGATAIVDRRDVVPLAILEAGGRIEQFGMPVDPGNLLLLGSIAEALIVGIPGCARSPKLNGFDWILERIHADMKITSRDVARMGVGGLLKEIPSRPQPRDAQSEGRTGAKRSVYAVVLAAGQSSRMGNRNKLLARLHGKPLLDHVLDALGEADIDGIVVVTGHESESVAERLADRNVSTVLNPAFATGLSSSLKAGLGALPEDADAALVCLGDMPLVDADTFNAVISSWKQAPERTICVPVHDDRYGNPVLWPRFYFSQIMELQGDAGARSLIGLHGDAVLTVPVATDTVLIDVDTASALKELDPGS
jgi:molybdenum cofactor cytidylyltransferase